MDHENMNDLIRYPRTILGTCCVPWDSNNEFEESIFRKHVRHLLEKGTRDLYIFGTAGEGYAVGEDLFDRIVSVFAQEMFADKAEPMVGIISLSLQTMISRIKKSREKGIRLFQISLPSWGACSYEEIHKFFSEICGKFEDCNFLYYNIGRTKRIITPEEFGLLSEEFPNLVATKNSNDSLRFIVDLFECSPRLRHFLTERAFTVASLLNFEAGLLVSSSSINWNISKAFYEACCNVDYATIAKYSLAVCEIQKIIASTFEKEGHMDGVFDKIYSKIMDNDFPLRLLPPYTYADDDVFEKFQTTIKNRMPEWLA